MLNRLVMVCAFKGLAKKKWEVAVFCFLSVLPVLSIFLKADAKPSGYLVVSAPVASAKYSLCPDGDYFAHSGHTATLKLL